MRMLESITKLLTVIKKAPVCYADMMGDTGANTRGKINSLEEPSLRIMAWIQLVSTYRRREQDL